MFQVEGTIESIATRKDKTVKVVIGTQELSPEMAAKLMALHQTYGWFLFNPNKIKPEFVPEEDAQEVGVKSPSKRMHDRMLAYWMDKHGNSKGFRSWYEESLEALGQRYLDKIPKP